MPKDQLIHILDDDIEYGELLREFVEHAGKRAVLETSPIQFVNTVLPNNGILILDLIMPEMDGIEVIRALAEKGSRLSLVLISGVDERLLHSAKRLAEANEIKILGCFAKPIKLATFKEFICHI